MTAPRTTLRGRVPAAIGFPVAWRGARKELAVKAIQSGAPAIPLGLIPPAASARPLPAAPSPSAFPSFPGLGSEVKGPRPRPGLAPARTRLGAPLPAPQQRQPGLVGRLPGRGDAQDAAGGEGQQ